MLLPRVPALAGWALLLLLSGAAQLFAADDQITSVTANNSSVNIEVVGKPVFATDSFSRGGASYFVLAFSHSILLGAPRLLHVLPTSSATVVAAQFTVNPDVVHVVVQDHRTAHYQVFTRRQPGNRYLVGLSFREHPRLNVFLDVGHGGYDPGGTGPEGLPESFVNLSVAKRLAAILRREGIEVEMDRTTDSYVSLSERVALANASAANLFLGLYCNASSDPSIHGTTTYYYHPNAYPFARYLEQHVARSLGLSADGVVKDNLYVVRYTTSRIPDVLIEYAYISNSSEERLLANPVFRDRIAAAIASAITGYFVHRTPQRARSSAAWVTSVKASGGEIKIHSIGKPLVHAFLARRGSTNYYVLAMSHTILAGRARSFQLGPPFSGNVTIAQYSANPDVVRLAIREDRRGLYLTKTLASDGSHFVTVIYPSAAAG